MSSEERKKILQMVEEGKISAEDAAKLMRALDEDVDDEAAEAEIEVIESRTDSGYESDASSASRRVEAPEFDTIKARARRPAERAGGSCRHRRRRSRVRLDDRRGSLHARPRSRRSRPTPGRAVGVRRSHSAP